MKIMAATSREARLSYQITCLNNYYISLHNIKKIMLIFQCQRNCAMVSIKGNTLWGEESILTALNGNYVPKPCKLVILLSYLVNYATKLFKGDDENQSSLWRRRCTHLKGFSRHRLLAALQAKR